MTLALAYDVDAIAKAGLDSGRLGHEAAAEQRAVHVDDRVSRPEGQSERHQGLERSDCAGHSGDHAEPENLRRRAMELPGRVAVCAKAQPGGDDAKAQRVRHRVCSETCPVLDSGARGVDDDVHGARHRRRVLLAWENEAYPRARGGQGQGRHRHAVDEHSCRAIGGGRRQRRRPARDTRRGARLPRISLFAGGAGDRGEAPLPSARRSRSRPEYAGAFADGEALHDRRRRSADGRTRRRRTSPMAESSIRSTGRAGR